MVGLISPDLRRRVAVFDMSMMGTSPAGSCVLSEINGLSDHYRIVAVSGELQNEQAENIEWLRVPLPRKPVLLRYLVFHALAPLIYLVWKVRGGHAVMVQATQGQFPLADIAYAHFCHRAYLRRQWRQSSVQGLRRWARWISHQFNAFCEARAFARCRTLVVPSQGLARDIAREYPTVRDKIEVIPNPVDLARFARPEDFDRKAKRKELGFDDTHLVLSFMALGDFARKGLGLLIEAFGKLAPQERSSLKLLVIGGQSGEIAEFRSLADQHGLTNQAVFVGLHKDVMPFLWASDIFALPSSYEIFSLAVLQGAASGLPVLVSAGLYGAEEFIVDGENGWQVPRDADSLHHWLRRILAERDKLASMAQAAVASVRQYSNDAFVLRWRTLYQRLLKA